MGALLTMVILTEGGGKNKQGRISNKDAIRLKLGKLWCLSLCLMNFHGRSGCKNKEGKKDIHRGPAFCLCSVLLLVFCFNVSPPSFKSRLLGCHSGLFNHLAHLSAAASGTFTCTSHSSNHKGHAFICSFHRLSFPRTFALHLPDFYRPFRTQLSW